MGHFHLRNFSLATASKRRDQHRQKSRSIRDAINQDAFVIGLRAFTDSAQPVERGHAECRCEIAVGAAPRGGFLKIHAELIGQITSRLEDPAYGWRALHRRTVEPTCYSNRTPFVDWA